MEHTAHVEQQLVADGDPSDVEVAQECLTRLMEMQEQLRKAPQNTIREGNDLLRALEQVGVVNMWVWSTTCHLCSDCPISIARNKLKDALESSVIIIVLRSTTHTCSTPHTHTHTPHTPHTHPHTLQGREDAGTSGMTPDKINAQSIIRKLLDKIGQRQMQLDDLWRERKVCVCVCVCVCVGVCVCGVCVCVCV